MSDNLTIASLANMRKYFRDGVMAWSPSTGEEYSADPSDYFMLSDDSVLRDSENEPMFLAYGVTSHVIINKELNA